MLQGHNKAIFMRKSTAAPGAPEGVCDCEWWWRRRGSGGEGGGGVGGDGDDSRGEGTGGEGAEVVAGPVAVRRRQ